MGIGILYNTAKRCKIKKNTFINFTFPVNWRRIFYSVSMVEYISLPREKKIGNDGLTSIN